MTPDNTKPDSQQRMLCHRKQKGIQCGRPVLKWGGLAALLMALAVLTQMPQAGAQEFKIVGSLADADRKSIVVPMVNPQRGRRLFVTKGCVMCHSIQEVGGRAAPALDADGPSASVDVLGFVSRLLRGAPAMLELQAIELGYQVELAPDEIADLAGFIADSREQEGFSMEEVPEPMRDWMLDEPYWEHDTWPEDLPDEMPDLEDEADL